MCENSCKNSERLLRKWQKTLGDTFLPHTVYGLEKNYHWRRHCGHGQSTFRRAMATNGFGHNTLPRDARSASAVLLSYVVRPSVYPSVRLSICDVAVSWAHRLD